MLTEYLRSALYVDFDNVFSDLLEVDETAALIFAEDPSVWLSGLIPGNDERRWLVRRCYMNASGSVRNPSAVDGDSRSQRLYFSRYRPFFTKAGFEVVDCPALTSRAKNAADIRIAIDVMEALGTSARYDEFILVSSDSDFTPLVVRMRAADRRTTIVSASPVAAAFESVADRYLGLQALLDALSPAPGLDRDTADTEVNGSAEDATLQMDTNAAAAYTKFGDWIRQRLAQSNDPLNLARLASEARREGVADPTWFGYQGFTRALLGLKLEGLAVSSRWLWDQSRHTAPSETEREELALPDPVARLCALIGVPRLPTETWPHVYRALAAYSEHHDFNLTDITKWSRDWLADQGIDVGRAVFGYVVRGAMYGGVSLKRRPSPTAHEIAGGFVTSVLEGAAAAQLHFSSEEASVVAEWLHAPLPPDAP